jgi:hypothetical protein
MRKTPTRIETAEGSEVTREVTKPGCIVAMLVVSLVDARADSLVAGSKGDPVESIVE